MGPISPECIIITCFSRPPLPGQAPPLHAQCVPVAWFTTVQTPQLAKAMQPLGRDTWLSRSIAGLLAKRRLPIIYPAPGCAIQYGLYTYK